jgi:dolichol-phosphate mannosyltransferase
MVDFKEPIVDGISLSIVIPIYNESDNIFQNLEECVKTIDSFGIKYEIIAVNDGSIDDTEQKVMDAAKKYPSINVITYSDNRGKGNAIIEGVKHASGSKVCFLDADLELHPRQLKSFLKEMDRTNADVVIGSKRHPDSVVMNYPKNRVWLSKGYNLMVKILFNLNLTDTQPGLKLFKREVLVKECPKLLVKRYAFDLELLYNCIADGSSVAEVPLEINFSRADGGRIGLRSVLGMFRDTLGIYYRAKIINYYKNKE